MWSSLLLLLLLDARTAEPRHANSAGWTNATGSALAAYCGYMAAFGPTEGNEEDDYLSVFPVVLFSARAFIGQGCTFCRPGPRIHRTVLRMRLLARSPVWLALRSADLRRSEQLTLHVPGQTINKEQVERLPCASCFGRYECFSVAGSRRGVR